MSHLAFDRLPQIARLVFTQHEERLRGIGFEDRDARLKALIPLLADNVGSELFLGAAGAEHEQLIGLFCAGDPAHWVTGRRVLRYSVSSPLSRAPVADTNLP
jgi:hypothetical protein